MIQRLCIFRAIAGCIEDGRVSHQASHTARVPAVTPFESGESFQVEWFRLGVAPLRVIEVSQITKCDGQSRVRIVKIARDSLGSGECSLSFVKPLVLLRKYGGVHILFPGGLLACEKARKQGN